MTTSCNRNLPSGSIVSGKWNRKTYRIIRKLGEGSNGTVYLVQGGRTRYALKMGTDAVDFQSEVNALDALSREDGAFAGFLADSDDYVNHGAACPFYVMKYVEGRQLNEFITSQGHEWVSVAGLRLLAKLADLHGKGWIFGDLKAENVLVSGYGHVHLVDFGGVSRKGRAVKQFTEVYDRAFWNAGSRTADEGYDLFAFGILCLQLLGVPRDLFSPRLLPQNRSPELLLEAADAVPACRKYNRLIRKLLTGGYLSAKEAYEDWNRSMLGRTGPADVEVGKGVWMKAALTISALLFISVMILYMKEWI